jgi:hypothetical protein
MPWVCPLQHPWWAASTNNSTWWHLGGHPALVALCGEWWSASPSPPPPMADSLGLQGVLGEQACRRDGCKGVGVGGTMVAGLPTLPAEGWVHHVLPISLHSRLGLGQDKLWPVSGGRKEFDPGGASPFDPGMDPWSNLVTRWWCLLGPRLPFGWGRSGWVPGVWVEVPHASGSHFRPIGGGCMGANGPQWGKKCQNPPFLPHGRHRHY